MPNTTIAINPANQRLSPRELAVSICKDFEYTQLAASSDGKITADVWRCSNPKSSDFAHDIVITKMGICAFGDMDPLVFTVGADYGMKFLAGNDVEYRMLSKLDSCCKEVDVDESVLMKVAADALANYLVNLWGSGDLDSIPSQSTRSALKDLEGAQPSNAVARINTCLFKLKNETGKSYWKDTPWERKPETLAGEIRDFVDELVGKSTHREVQEVISNSPFDECFEFDSEPGYLKPTDNLLTRLFVLQLSAKRILQQQSEIESHGEQSVDSYACDQRGG